MKCNSRSTDVHDNGTALAAVRLKYCIVFAVACCSFGVATGQGKITVPRMLFPLAIQLLNIAGLLLADFSSNTVHQAACKLAKPFSWLGQQRVRELMKAAEYNEQVWCETIRNRKHDFITIRADSPGVTQGCFLRCDARYRFSNFFICTSPLLLIILT